MADSSGTITDQAIAWHVRQDAMDAADWHDFIVWLEADPAHARAYDRVALSDRGLADIDWSTLRPAPAPMVAPVVAAHRRRRGWRWGAGGVAVAATIALFAIPRGPVATARPYTVATEPGQRQQVALADGTRIEISGGSRLVLDRADPRIATLEAGEATFHVRHDADHPFTVRSGDIAIRDIGTVFNISRAGSQLDVAVAEGSVMFQPGGEALVLKAGHALSAREDSGKLVLTQVAIDTVGGWRNGRLAFAGAPLPQVAATIGRLYGIDVQIAPGLSDRPFTGMVEMSGVAERDMPHLAALVGAGWQHDGERWILSPLAPEAR